MSTTRLNKWGNSQGVIIPKKLCERAGFRVGDPLEIAMNSRTGKIEIVSPKASLSRSQ